MTPTEKYNEEKEDAKTLRKNRILASAFELFSTRGIDTIAITDIAKKAEIGVASIYRYYETKDQIAINTAIWAWGEESENIMPFITGSEYESKSGFEQLKIICSCFRNIFEENALFLRFIYFFDSYAFRQDIAKDNFDEYESSIKFVQNKILSAIENGVNDKSIKCPEGYTTKDLYFTLMHSLFSMVQKLSLSADLLEMNKEVSAVKQIELLITILLSSIKG